ncbi:hypothetical protein [Olsenella sp. Marseille-P4559]|jgi:hypothetical protein|uniref:hypothetical protein n=1 Tax=Olsenella sp. Marseille-P4559 TaxID=2364795 RepID=UPI00103149EB|nr:hypothetical protein [Olsenella sp. Marseille-P4559]
MTNVLGVASTVGYVLAALLALVAVILFFTLHIRSVRDELTGRTAAAAIAQMRGMTWAARRRREAVARRLTADGTGAPEGEGSGSLHLRMVDVPGRKAGDTAGPARTADEAVTTMLASGHDGEDEGDEAMTTTLSLGADGGDEDMTVVVTDGAPAEAAADDELETTLLEGSAAGEGSGAGEGDDER